MLFFVKFLLFSLNQLWATFSRNEPHGETWFIIRRATRQKDFVDWLVGFNGLSNFVGYLMQNPFYTNNQFSFKQFSLA